MGVEVIGDEFAGRDGEAGVRGWKAGAGFSWGPSGQPRLKTRQVLVQSLSEREQRGLEALDSFSNAGPVQMETVSVMDDVSELPVAGERDGDGALEEHRQCIDRRSGEVPQEIHVPGLPDGERNAVETAQTLQDVLYATIELGQKRRGRCPFSDGRLADAHISHQGDRLEDRCLEESQLDGDFLLELGDLHSSALPLCSTIRVKGVGGSSGMRSTTACNSSSIRPPNS